MDGLVHECGLPTPDVKPMRAPPCGRYDEGPVHRFDTCRRLTPVVPMSTNRIPAASDYPLELACNADAVRAAV
jgi:hypothetical protein